METKEGERERESMCDEGDVDKGSSLLSRILVIDFSKCTKNYLFTIVIWMNIHDEVVTFSTKIKKKKNS